MTKLLVYSHDTYGLGNIRRMLAICDHLINVIPELSILLVTGSPVIHSLRLPEKMDYIKLPCLTRLERGEYTTKYLSENLEAAIGLRADLIRTTAARFRPDLFLVDKKPMGVKRELGPTLEYLVGERPETRLVLVLRDILDRPEAIISNWSRNGHYDAIADWYHRVLVLGEREIFDVVSEYQFPPAVAAKTRFCGYIEKRPALESVHEIRRDLNPGDRLVTVTAGGGQDGFGILETYLRMLPALQDDLRLKSIIVSGPEMPQQQQVKLQELAAGNPGVTLLEFRNDLLEILAASDAVITMGGYNTICEILSLKKPALVIPRIWPTEEQLMRAECMSRHGFLRMIHPADLTPQVMGGGLSELLTETSTCFPSIDLNALPVVRDEIACQLHLHV